MQNFENFSICLLSMKSHIFRFFFLFKYTYTPARVTDFLKFILKQKNIQHIQKYK